MTVGSTDRDMYDDFWINVMSSIFISYLEYDIQYIEKN